MASRAPPPLRANAEPERAVSIVGVGTLPVTPRSCRNGADAPGAVAFDTPPKHHPPLAIGGHAADAGVGLINAGMTRDDHARDDTIMCATKVVGLPCPLVWPSDLPRPREQEVCRAFEVATPPVVDTPPVTPSSRRSVAVATVVVAFDTLPSITYLLHLTTKRLIPTLGCAMLG